MEAALSIAMSILRMKFSYQARTFLAARHGLGTRISPRSLYFEADLAFQEALRLARELGDQKKELEILYYWGRLQHHPPVHEVSFHGPMTPREVVEQLKERREADSEAAHIQEPIPTLAVRFYKEALPLAEKLGDNIRETELLLFSARAYREMGEPLKGEEMATRLSEKLAEMSKTGLSLPHWLEEAIKEETLGESQNEKT